MEMIILCQATSLKIIVDRLVLMRIYKPSVLLVVLNQALQTTPRQCSAWPQQLPGLWLESVHSAWRYACFACNRYVFLGLLASGPSLD